jgi:1,4-dihydroxy-2-naphthoate octaprenyltransferase
VLVERLTWLSIVAAVAVGFLACALLVVNNLRDIPTDLQAGKRTLAVRIGDRATRWLYVQLVDGAFVVAVLVAVIWRPWAALAVIAGLLAIAPARLVLGGAKGRELIAALAATGRLQLGFGLLFTVGLALSG